MGQVAFIQNYLIIDEKDFVFRSRFVFLKSSQSLGATAFRAQWSADKKALQDLRCTDRTSLCFPQSNGHHCCRPLDQNVAFERTM